MKKTEKENVIENGGEYYLNDYLERELVIYSVMADMNNVTGELKEVNIPGNGLIGKIMINNSSKYVNEQLACHKNFYNRVNIILI